MSTPAIPPGFHTVTPYLAIKNAVEALEFYKKAFGAVETFRLMMPDGRLGHAEIRLGDSMIMLSDEFPEYDGGSRQKHWAVGQSASTYMSMMWTHSFKGHSLRVLRSARQ